MSSLRKRATTEPPRGGRDQAGSREDTASDLIGGRGQGTLLTLSCGSGREVLSEALPAQGYATHIGPRTPYYASDAGLLFAFAYLYALLSPDRDFAVPMSAAEAFELAASIDPRNPSGPSVMVRRSRDVSPDSAKGRWALGWPASRG